MSAPTMRADNVDKWYKGTVDLYSRPKVKNEDGSISTVRSMSVGITDEKGKNREMLIPTVSKEGKIMTPDEALQYARSTGEHMGIYKNVREANKAAQAIHDQQASLLTGGQL